MMTPVFIINVIQDVAVIRPLVYLLADDLGIRSAIILTQRFIEQDTCRQYIDSIVATSLELNLEIYSIKDLYELQDIWSSFEDACVIVSSESTVNQRDHKSAHKMLLTCPRRFKTVMIQHGFECVGFLHNEGHNKNYGLRVGSAADFILSWFSPSICYSTASYVKQRLIHVGPSILIKHTSKRSLITRKDSTNSPQFYALICENLHSVRFSQEARDRFPELLKLLSNDASKAGRYLALRPHPAGRYVQKNNIHLPDNVILETQPSFQVDWRMYRVGLSSPSTILIDMLYGGLRTAVTAIPAIGLDVENYSFLPVLKSISCICDFVSREKLPAELPTMPWSPHNVARRYREFFAELLHLDAPPNANTLAIGVNNNRDSSAHPHVLIVAPDKQLPTAVICLKKPLENGDSNISVQIIDDKIISKMLSSHGHVRDFIGSLKPDYIIFCRYFGKHARNIRDFAREKRIPVIYHLDDDLLNPCIESLGEHKFRIHGSPNRIQAIRSNLAESDLIYASTQYLGSKLKDELVDCNVSHTSINCSPVLGRFPLHSPSPIIGYTGFGHEKDFLTVLQPLLRLMSEYQELKIEIVGSVPIPPALDKYTSRICKYNPIYDYEEFLLFVRSRKWLVGLCPLLPTEFNKCKSVNKWVEYSQCGIPTVASSGTIYDDCCSFDCGILCSTEDEWHSAITRLLRDQSRRNRIVSNAMFRLLHQFSAERHKSEIMNLLRYSEIVVQSRVSL